MKKTQQERMKAERELELIQNELRNFDQHANQLIN